MRWITELFVVAYRLIIRFNRLKDFSSPTIASATAQLRESSSFFVRIANKIKFNTMPQATSGILQASFNIHTNWKFQKYENFRISKKSNVLILKDSQQQENGKITHNLDYLYYLFDLFGGKLLYSPKIY